MCRFIRKAVAGLLIFLILGVLIINKGIEPRFTQLFQNSITRQYDSLKNLKEESKIVLIGPSSLGFGTNMEELERLSGKKCQLLGGHYGYGNVFFLEMSKPYLQKGDIVVIEYANFEDDFFGADLLLTGIDNRLSMLRFLKPYMWKAAAMGYPDYVQRKIKRLCTDTTELTGPYAGAAFNERGNQAEWYEQCTLEDPYDGSMGYAEFETGKLYEGTIRRVNEYVKYCQKQGVKVYFTVQPYFEEGIVDNKEKIEAYDSYLRDKLAAPLISNSLDYIFSREYVGDGISHLNKEGAIIRTQKLWEDLQKAEALQ